MLTFGSLFAGIGGLDLGLERAGLSCRFQVELDPYASRVLAQHWPAVARHRDVREVGAHNLPPVDLLCGGFPCQDISNAGKRAGIEGARSGLWGEFARLVRELRPRYVLVENVAALRSRGLGRVLGDLAACGLDAEWDCIPAAAVGAPHLRDRLFVFGYRRAPAGALAHAHGERRPERRRAGPGRAALASAQPGGEALAHPDGQRLPQRGQRHRQPAPGLEAPQRHHPGGRGAAAPSFRFFGSSPEHSGFWEVEPAVGRVADGLPGRVAQLRCLGNAVVPQVAEHLGRRLLAFHACR